MSFSLGSFSYVGVHCNTHKRKRVILSDFYYKGCMLRLCTLMNNWVVRMCQPVCECFNGAALLQNNCNSSVALLSISCT